MFKSHLKKYLPIYATIVILQIWLVFFIIGTTIDSSRFRRGLAEPKTELLDSIICLIGIFFSWTWSNVLVLCCLSSLIGEFTRKTNSERFTITNIHNSIIRGFFIYLTIVTGQIVIQGSIPSLALAAESNPSAVGIPQYFRVASFSSLLSFLVGFNPNLFKTIVKRIDTSSGKNNSEPIED